MSAMISDLRVCFVGDSFVAGVGDPEHLGWAGRTAARTHRSGQPLTAYNLGVRRDTGPDVGARWHTESAARLPEGCTGAVVFSFGVNDTAGEHGRTRVPQEHTVDVLDALVADALRHGHRVLVTGPPPVADAAHTDRVRELSAAFAHTCAARGVPFVDTVTSLSRNLVWLRQVAEGDGAHPSAEGYAAYAEVVWPRWRNWLGLGTDA